MKKLKNLAPLILAICLAGGALAALADDSKGDAKPKTKLKPYILKTCPVSGDKLGEMGKPYTFVYEGQEVKLCCSGCKKDFDKDPAQYLKKIRAADKK